MSGASGTTRSAQAERTGRAREALRGARLDGLLVTHLPNVRYLSGFAGSTALLLLLPDAAVLITDFRYEQQAGEELDGGVSLRVARDGLVAELASVLEERGVAGRIGFETERVSVGERRELGEKCDRCSWEPAPPVVEELRRRKDAEEVGYVARAAEIAAASLRDVLAVVRQGMREREVAAELDYRMRLRGSDPPPFESIVASGPRTALPHARPSERRLREGDLLLFDFGARVEGYCCDVTRVAVLGAEAPWQREIHTAVCEALEAALASVREGRAAREVDRAAREVLEEAGLSERFGHSTGHGLGLEVHEAPRLHRRSDELLEAGNVVTVEPGVYLPGRGGVRIEENVVVEEGGARLLTALPRRLLKLS